MLESLGLFPDMLPSIAGKYSGLLIIVAGARCVWDDLEKAGMAKNSDHDVMCVNDIVMHYPGPIEHFYSNDHIWIPKWIDARRQLMSDRFGKVKHQHSLFHTQWNWPWPGHGSSSLGACYTALGLGYDEVWLCGGHLDNTGHYFDAPWIGSNFAVEVAQRDKGPRYWENARKFFKGRVKSFSGRTKELLSP